MWGNNPSDGSNNNGGGGGGGDETSSMQNNYYFLNRNNSDRVVEVVEEIPPGSTKDEFAPKVLHPIESPAPSASARKQAAPIPPPPPAAGPTSSNNNNNRNATTGSGGGGFWSNLFGGGGGGGGNNSVMNMSTRSTPMDNGGGGANAGVGTLLKLRKAPIKIEPKVFFANERTFLAWMHLSVTLAGASIAILAFAEDNNPASQLYGVLLLPVALAFILYSMYQYSRRAYMIRNRHPGPYEDTVGPAFLGIMLMVSIIAQFALKLYAMSS